MTTQITLIRSGNYYLHSIHRAGTQVAPAVAINAERAREIHERNIGAEQCGRGLVNFDPAGGDWERSYFVGDAPTFTTHQLRHPEHDDVTATAAIVNYWFEAGRWIGFRLRFAGESGDRCLTFGEIRQLRVDEVAV